MKTERAMSLEQIRAFLNASEEVEFEGCQRTEVYGWVGQTLIEHEYHRQGKAVKGLLRSYLEKMTGLSRAQVTRLIGQYAATGEVKSKLGTRRRFPRLYTAQDVELLAEVDEAHETLSGPATRQILHREYHEFGHAGYQRLAGISVAHLYNLRRTAIYRKRRVVYQPTRPTATPSGEGRIPKDSPAISGWTPFTKATGMASRASITSMPWTR